jgi:hypothetical protein
VRLALGPRSAVVLEAHAWLVRGHGPTATRSSSVACSAALAAAVNGRVVSH